MKRVPELDLMASGNLAGAGPEGALCVPGATCSGTRLGRAAAAGGIDGSHGMGKLPIIWPGSSGMSPNHGPAPDVS